MWTLDDILTENESLSMDTILKYVDDYSIYTHYIGEELELKTPYSSPFRIDDHPSFNLFQGGDGGIYFKDHATANKGDVFEFVQIMLEKTYNKKFSFHDVLKQIDIDFELGLYVVSSNGKTRKKLIKKHREPTALEIGVSSRTIPSKLYKEFWAKYDISDEILKIYNTTNILVVHYSTPAKKSFYYPKLLGIAYRIGDKYKLYFPYADKIDKFRTNYPRNWVEGFIQLKYEKDFCLITKAMKEVLFFRQHFDWDTIAGKSENTMISEHIMRHLLIKYKKVYIMLDNDLAGQVAQAEYISKYPGLISIYYPETTLHKDPTDRYAFLKEQGRQQEALNEIKNLINGTK